MKAEDWDARYEANPVAFGEAPNAFLHASRGMLPAGGRVLLPADGQGRNALWLAQEGFDCVSIDHSSVGMAQLREKATAAGLQVDARVEDFLTAPFEPGSFDIVVATYLHLPPEMRRAAHARMAQAVRPGGLVLIEAFGKGQAEFKALYNSGGPKDEALHYDLAMLREDFAPLAQIYGESLRMVLGEGDFHTGLAQVVRAIFRREG